MKNPDAEIIQLIYRYLGESVRGYDEKFLLQTIQNLARAAASGTTIDFLEMLQSNASEKSQVLQALLIGYSAFYREPLTFATLDEFVLPQLIKQKRFSKNKEIRIWSAACAAGQEAYSLAMLLQHHLNEWADDFSYRIFGTDASAKQIQAAQKGFYHANAIGNLPYKWVSSWFSKTNEGYQIKEQLKERIHFSVFDLLDPDLNSPPASIFGNFDLVFCANLLFYYKKKYRERIMQKIKYALAPNALLVTGQTETAITKSFNFIPVFADAPVFKIYQ
jgi:chemotaxis methyl-accepting protein methylase